MTFPGRFAESFLPDQLANISVSFLASDLQVRRGGVAANISYGLAQLGCPSVLLGAVGVDFDQYLQEYVADAPAVDMSAILHVSDTHTARFTCTTDTDQAQIATFFPGAMSAARSMKLAELHSETPIDLAIISPNDPEAMKLQTTECRELGIPFVADPSQQVTFMDGETLRHLLDGAQYLFSNHHEAELIEQRTGWSAEQLSERIQTRVITRGKDGSDIYEQNGNHFHTPAVQGLDVLDPTGGGDAFRAGYFAGLSWGLEPVACAQVGTVLAACAVSAVGPQGYTAVRNEVLAHLENTFGAHEADAVAQHLA